MLDAQSILRRISAAGILCQQSSFQRNHTLSVDVLDGDSCHEIRFVIVYRVDVDCWCYGIALKLALLREQCCEFALYCSWLQPIKAWSI